MHNREIVGLVIVINITYWLRQIRSFHEHTVQIGMKVPPYRKLHTAQLTYISVLG